MRALATWSGACAGPMLILVGGLIPAAFVVPTNPLQVLLIYTRQVPALLICTLSGPRSGLAAMVHLTVGLVDLPVFHEGGGLGYLLNQDSATWPVSCPQPGSRTSLPARRHE